MAKLVSIKGRAIIVDDDPELCGLMIDILTQNGYGASYVGSIAELERELCREQFDLLILDLDLPVEGGLSYLERMNAHTLKMPVLVMTGNPRLTIAVDCFKAGASDCIFKPFSQGQLLEAIDRCLMKGGKAKADNRSAGIDKTLAMEDASPLPRAMGMDKTIVMEGDVVTTVAGYEIEGILGQGNMGIVYLTNGMDTAGNPCKYALKVLKPPMISNPEELKKLEERFMIEARATYLINHPNVVATHDYGLCDKHVPYILMEYCPGKGLDQLIGENALSLEEKCHLLRQIAKGLCAIHTEGMCHRDIKPANVIVSDDLTAKIADFGLVRLGDSCLTMTSDVFGTPAYLSPEAFVSAKVDFRSDLFSFGCLAYQLIVGQPPFKGESVCAIARAICETDPIWPRQLDPSVPPELDTLIRRTLKKKATHRFDDSNEVVALLDSCTVD